ncbi:MAG: cysteine desulfurase [Methylobacterium mesophilicum]|nr:cysteine desulfurase [Methylobacterium mesophilicum]
MAPIRAYLDWNASAPLRPVARDAMLQAMDNAANPSSVHAEGRAARALVENARKAVASFVGMPGAGVVFTSGATEAASYLLTPDWRDGRTPLRYSHLYVCDADHPCTRNGGRFPADRVTLLPVDRRGLLDLDALSRALAVHDASEGLPLVACHAANNETGVVQDWAKIGRIVRAANGRFVLDAVQAAGRLPFDLSSVRVDHLILSAHKLGGPKGVGAVVSQSPNVMPVSLVSGGGQEKGFRAGTENVPAIAGFAAALGEAAGEIGRMAEVAALRDRFEAVLLERAPDAVIYGRDAGRLPNTTFFTIPGLRAETAQIGFDLAGLALSAGSACSSGKVGPSHVLRAMGMADDGGALRVSVGLATCESELDAFAKALDRVMAGRTRAAA